MEMSQKIRGLTFSSTTWEWPRRVIDLLPIVACDNKETWPGIKVKERADGQKRMIIVGGGGGDFFIVILIDNKTPAVIYQTNPCNYVSV